MIYLYGLQDVLIPVENGFAFAQEDSVPNIQFFYPDQCGHQGQTDQPETFNQAALEFFKFGKVSWATARSAGVSLRRPINPDLVEEPPGGFPRPGPQIYESPEVLASELRRSFSPA
jgi:2-hydroxy-6-oxonona-2,4-dienedioate hydrolase